MIRGKRNLIFCRLLRPHSLNLDLKILQRGIQGQVRQKTNLLIIIEHQPNHLQPLNSLTPPNKPPHHLTRLLMPRHVNNQFHQIRSILQLGEEWPLPWTLFFWVEILYLADPEFLDFLQKLIGNEIC